MSYYADYTKRKHEEDCMALCATVASAIHHIEHLSHPALSVYEVYGWTDTTINGIDHHELRFCVSCSKQSFGVFRFPLDAVRQGRHAMAKAMEVEHISSSRRKPWYYDEDEPPYKALVEAVTKALEA